MGENFSVIIPRLIFVCSLGGSCQELTGRVQPRVWRTSHRACLSCLCVYLPGFWRKCSTPKIWREPPQKYCHSKQVRSTARSSSSNDLDFFPLLWTTYYCFLQTLRSAYWRDSRVSTPGPVSTHRPAGWGRSIYAEAPPARHRGLWPV